jgi:uncharacterized membrane protein YfcA
MTAALAVAIGLIALLYASVGHAGATGYTAVLALAGAAPAVIRPTALVLNVVVAAIGTVQFVRAGHFRRGLFLPLAAASVPCAALGGAIGLSTAAFETLLGIVLLCSAVRIVTEAVGARGAGTPAAGADRQVVRTIRPPLLGLLGAGIGLLSGLTGVGGGVFLTPVLLAIRAAPVRQVAAVTAPFILVNSLAGLAGFMAAGGSLPPLGLPLVAAAVAGGVIGAQLGAFRLPVPILRLVMAVVLLVAAAKLLGGSMLARPARGHAGNGPGVRPAASR